MTTLDGNTALDANAAGGDLRTVFALDVPAATVSVRRLRQHRTARAAQLYNRAPGLILRCPSCDAVSCARSRTRAHLAGVRGLTYLSSRPTRTP